jgi:hypothetical protein
MEDSRLGKCFFPDLETDFQGQVGKEGRGCHVLTLDDKGFASE